MATLLDEGYEGANGVAISNANTAYSNVVGTGMTFDTSVFVNGTSSASVITSAASTYGRLDFTAVPSVSIRSYVRWTAIPGAITYWMSVLNSSTARAQVRVNVDGTLSVRNGSTAVGSTTAVMNPNQWYRVEWVLDSGAGSQQLKLFDLHQTSVVSGGDTGAVTFNLGTIDNFRLGTTAASTADFRVDSTRVDDTNSFIGPSVAPPSSWSYGYDVVIG